MLEKRVLIASILSVIILLVYAQVLTQRAGQGQKPTGMSQPQGPIQKEPQSVLTQRKSDEEVITIEAEKILLEIGRKTASAHSVVLKDFKGLTTKTPLKLSWASPIIIAEIGDEEEQLTFVAQEPRRTVWQGHSQGGVLKELEFKLHETLPLFEIAVSLTNRSGERKQLPIRLVMTWGRSDELSGRYNLLEAVFLSKERQPWQRTHLRYMDGQNKPMDVPRGTSLITLSERYFCQVMKPDPNAKTKTSLFPAQPGTIAVLVESQVTIEPNEEARYSATMYVGPRDFFRLREAGFDQAFALGFLSQIGLLLMLVLKGIASIVHNYGTAVILLAGIVTTLLSPFTLISFRSMRKLQELQPKIEQLKKKYANDAQRLNRETLALFREHRVSPLSGCLPMLLQLPVFFALWSAISHVIELRGEPFLWIKDLSLPDRLATLPFGVDLNILPILMAVAMYAQARQSQRNVPTTGTSFFSGPFMAVMFGVMFYQVPSSLVLYWLTNSVISLAFYKLAH